MRQILKYAVAGLIFLHAVPALAIPSRPVPQRLVNDFAGILTPSQRNMLETRLVAFDDSTSNQIAVVTVNDLEGCSPAEFGTEIGLQWKVGSEKFDNGIVVVVKPKSGNSSGQVNISVGYGLEGAIPDSYAKRIIDNEMIPSFMNNDYYTGINDACTVLMKLASGEISEPGQDGGTGVAAGIIFSIIFLIVMISVITSAGNGRNNGGGRRYQDDDGFLKGVIIGSILGNSGGRDYPGGGSFGGGFGGFGGGSFGGGGASGSW